MDLGWGERSGMEESPACSPGNRVDCPGRGAEHR